MTKRISEDKVDNAVQSDRCKQCGICIEVCPVKVIGANQDGFTTILSERESLCLQCGQCMAVCPSQAIQIDGLSYEDNLAEIRPFRFDHDEFTNFLSARRSVRNFADRSVSNDVIRQILDSIHYAPFGAHPEKVEITVVNDRSIIESALPLISQFLDRIVPMIENPIVSFVVRKVSKREEFNTVKNHLYPIAKLGTYKLEAGDRITRGAPAMILFHADQGAEAHSNNSMIYATYAMLQAHALGLGATMVEIVPSAINRVKELKKIFRIPETHDVSMSLVLGYPKYRYKRSIKRPVQDVHWIGGTS
jgi:NAD-dependent dihydropyrimidine dehydrogenase PreA subunit/nitroreductase